MNQNNFLKQRPGERESSDNMEKMTQKLKNRKGEASAGGSFPFRSLLSTKTRVDSETYETAAVCFEVDVESRGLLG